MKENTPDFCACGNRKPINQPTCPDCAPEEVREPIDREGDVEFKEGAD